MQQGLTDNGRPKILRAEVTLHSGIVIRDAPSPIARAASSRFCALG